MSISVGTPLSLDVGPPLAALDRLIAADANFRAEQQKTSASINTSYAEMARQALAYSDGLKRQQDEVRNAVAATRSAAEEVRRLTAANQELAAAAKKSTNTDEVKRLGQEIERNTAKIREAKQAILDNRAATRQERQGVLDLVEARRQSVNQTKLGAAAARDVAAANKEAAAAEREAAKAAKDQAAAEKKAAAEADKQVRDAGLLVQLERQLADLTERRARATTKGEAQGYKGQIDSVGSQIAELKNGPAAEGEGFFSGLVSKAAAATAGFFAFNEVSRRVKQGLEDFGAIKGIQATLAAVAGSAAEGAQEFAYIKREATSLGLELVPTGKAYAGLFAAAKEANLSVATTRDVFEGVAGAAKVLNLTAADTNGVLLALQQIASKGTVASEELRGQIGERLPGAFGLAAKAMGLTTQELGKQLQAGKVLSNDFLPKFAAQLKATYGDATADAATQVGSNLGRINTFFSESSAKVGQAVAPYVAALAQLVTPTKTLTEVAQTATDAYFQQADATKALVQNVTPLLARYEELNGTTGRNTAQQKELDSVIQQLAKSVPGAVTEFDKYGKALGINGEAVKKFIEGQQNLTRYNNRDALQKNRAALVELINQQDELQRQINNTTTGADGLKRRQAAEAISGGTGGGGTFVRTLSQAESDKITADYTAKLTQVQLDIEANLLNRDKLRGLSPLLPKLPAPAEIQGLIEKQQGIIKDLKARQVKATDENQGDGGDFLFGKGGLNKALEAAEKELARLEGKVAKGRKTSDDALQARLRALFNERRMLTEMASKAELKASDDEAERARINYELSLAQIKKIKDALIQRELDVAKAARKRGGEALVKKQGGNADGVLDGVQDQQLAALNTAAANAYNKELERIAEARAKRILELSADSNDREIALTNLKYDELREKAGDYQSAEELALDEAAGVRLDKSRKLTAEELAIEAARGRALLLLQAQQGEKQAELEKQLADSAANLVGQTYGRGTGQSKPEAELEEQRLLLANERKYLVEKQNLTLLKQGEAAAAERQALEAQLKRIDNQEKALNDKAKKFDFNIAKLILGDDDDGEGGPKRQKLQAALDATVSQVTNSLNEINAVQQQAAQQRAADATQRINELTATLSAEQQLNASGSASNIKGTLDEIEQNRQLRRQALNDQRQAAREKVVIDTLTQASAIATSVANIIEGFSLIPVVGPILGLAASAFVVGGFIASKVQAYQAAGNIGKGFFKGGLGTTGYTGDGNPHDESRELGRKGYTYHKQEYILPHDVTQQYRLSLLEPLHKGQFDKIDWSGQHMQALLPDLSLPDKFRQEKAESVRIQHEHTFAPMKQDFDRLHARLEAIEGSNQAMLEKPDMIPLGAGRYQLRWANGSTHTINVQG